MKIKDMMAMSLKNLLKRKVRTCLTVAGVLIGTCAIVVMLSIGLGLTEGMNQSLQQMGDITMIQIYNYNQSAEGTKLDDAAIDSIRSLEHVTAVTPIYDLPWGACAISSGKYRYDGMVYGLDLTALEKMGYTLDDGAFPDESQAGNTILFSRESLYSFYNTKKKSNNRVNQYPDANGNIPDPYVDPLSDKLEVQVLTNEGELYGRPIRLQSTALLTSDYSRNPPTSYSAFIDISLAKELTELYNKANKVRTDPQNKGINYSQAVIKAESVEYVDPLSDKLEVQVLTNEGELYGRPIRLQSTALLTSDYSRNPPTSYSAFIDISLAKELTELYNKANKVRTDPQNKGINYSQAVIKAESVEYVQELETAIHDMGFTDTYSMENVRGPVEEMMNMIQLVLGGIGAVSLIVAALGIINTMIMSIYERTREIGVMKVLGCVVGNIRVMFLMEAGMIGLMGGLVGLVISYAASAVINYFAASGDGNVLGGMLGMMSTGTPISVIPPWLAAGSVVFAVGVGVLSGILPANRAVKISALTAIKQE